MWINGGGLPYIYIYVWYKVSVCKYLYIYIYTWVCSLRSISQASNISPSIPPASQTRFPNTVELKPTWTFFWDGGIEGVPLNSTNPGGCKYESYRPWGHMCIGWIYFRPFGAPGPGKQTKGWQVLFPALLTEFCL